MEMIPLLEKLTQACGVAGDEGPIADLLEQEIKDIGPVRRTPLQLNLYRQTGSARKAPRGAGGAHRRDRPDGLRHR